MGFHSWLFAFTVWSPWLNESSAHLNSPLIFRVLWGRRVSVLVCSSGSVDVSADPSLADTGLCLALFANHELQLDLKAYNLLLGHMNSGILAKWASSIFMINIPTYNHYLCTVGARFLLRLGTLRYLWLFKATLRNSPRSIWRRKCWRLTFCCQ